MILVVILEAHGGLITVLIIPLNGFKGVTTSVSRVIIPVISSY